MADTPDESNRWARGLLYLGWALRDELPYLYNPTIHPGDTYTMIVPLFVYFILFMAAWHTLTVMLRWPFAAACALTVLCFLVLMLVFWWRWMGARLWHYVWQCCFADEYRRICQERQVRRDQEQEEQARIEREERPVRSIVRTMRVYSRQSEVLNNDQCKELCELESHLGMLLRQPQYKHFQCDEEVAMLRAEIVQKVQYAHMLRSFASTTATTP